MVFLGLLEKIILVASEKHALVAVFFADGKYLKKVKKMFYSGSVTLGKQICV